MILPGGRWRAQCILVIGPVRLAIDRHKLDRLDHRWSCHAWHLNLINWGQSLHISQFVLHRWGWRSKFVSDPRGPDENISLGLRKTDSICKVYFSLQCNYVWYLVLSFSCSCDYHLGDDKNICIVDFTSAQQHINHTWWVESCKITFIYCSRTRCLLWRWLFTLHSW